MPVNIVGTSAPVVRVETGFFTFDRALANRAGQSGIPLKSTVELYGATGLGKTTLAMTLAAKICGNTGKIAFADLESSDVEFLAAVLENSGYDGDLVLVQSEEDETIIDKLCDNVLESCRVGIFDSIGAVSPIMEVEGKSKDVIWGKRAILMGKFSRRATHIHRVKKDPSVFFLTNHVQKQMRTMGGMELTTTPGGDSTKFLAMIRIKLFRKTEVTPDGYLICGKVEKNRFGYTGREFRLYNLAGYGIHAGMTAVYDCIGLGLAKKDRTITLEGKSYGFASKLLTHWDEPDYYLPFHNALKKISVLDNVKMGVVNGETEEIESEIAGAEDTEA